APGLGGDDFGEPLVDRARALAAEIGVKPIVVLQGRARDRLHVDSHFVHIGEALLDRRQFAVELRAQLLLVFHRALVAVARERVAVARGFRNLVGARRVYMAMQIDGERRVFALDRLASGSALRGPARRPTCKQHSVSFRSRGSAMLATNVVKALRTWPHAALDASVRP